MSKFYERREDGAIEIDPQLMYPHYLKVIGHEGEITQGAMETARLVCTEDLMQVFGPPLHIIILTKDGAHALRNFPVGEPPKNCGDLSPFYRGLPGTAVTRLGIVS